MQKNKRLFFILIAVTVLSLGCRKKIPEEYSELKLKQELLFKPVRAGAVYGSFSVASVEFTEDKVVFKGRIYDEKPDTLKIIVYNPKGKRIKSFNAKAEEGYFEFSWKKPAQVENGIYTFYVQHICKTPIYIDVEHGVWLYVESWKFK